MANCSQCKWSDETVKHILLCYHIKHPHSRCSKLEHECAEFEQLSIPEFPDN